MTFKSLKPIDQIRLPEEEQRYIPKFYNIDYVIENILHKFEDINSVDDEELKKIICRQHKLILDYDNFLSNNREFAQKLFMNKKFLNCLLDIIGTLVLERDEKICINKLCYDYIRLPPENKNQEILDILMSISYYVNNKLVIRLMSELPIKESRLLAIISNSSFKLEKNIHRINWFLTWAIPNGFNITNIYLILFDHMMYPIIYTLLDIDPNVKTNEIANKNYNQITASILTLLLCMTSDDIYKVLTNYGYIWILYGKPETRVKFKELQELEQFDRIKKVLKRIEIGPYSDIEIP